MWKFAAFLGVVVIGIVFSPQFIENAPSPCGALASKAMYLEASAPDELGSPIARALVNSFAGPIVEALVQAANPNVPASVACSWTYWRITLDPAARAELHAALQS